MHGIVAKNGDTKGYKSVRGEKLGEFVAVLHLEIFVDFFFYVFFFFFCIRENLGMNRMMDLLIVLFRICFFFFCIRGSLNLNRE